MFRSMTSINSSQTKSTVIIITGSVHVRLSCNLSLVPCVSSMPWWKYCQSGHKLYLCPTGSCTYALTDSCRQVATASRTYLCSSLQQSHDVCRGQIKVVAQSKYHEPVWVHSDVCFSNSNLWGPACMVHLSYCWKGMSVYKCCRKLVMFAYQCREHCVQAVWTFGRTDFWWVWSETEQCDVVYMGNLLDHWEKWEAPKAKFAVDVRSQWGGNLYAWREILLKNCISREHWKSEISLIIGHLASGWKQFHLSRPHKIFPAPPSIPERCSK